MDERVHRIMAAYKNYFRDKWKEDVEDILDNSKSLEEADQKLNEKMSAYDQAWDQVCHFYHLDEEDDEEEE